MRFGLLVTPTLSILAPKLASAEELLEARYTLPVNLAGVPALALPIPASGLLPGQRTAGVFVGQRGAPARRGAAAAAAR